MNNGTNEVTGSDKTGHDSAELHATTFVIDGMAFSFEEAAAYRAKKKAIQEQQKIEEREGAEALVRHTISDRRIRHEAAVKEQEEIAARKQAALQKDLRDHALEATGQGANDTPFREAE